MSGPNRVPVVTEAAQRDYDDVLAGSLRVWGEYQADEYKRALDRALDRLATFPLIGAARDELGTGYRSLLVGQHVILYRVEQGQVRVEGIIHQSRDLRSAIQRMSN